MSLRDIKKTDKRLIIWNKWRDPFGEDIEDFEWPGAFGTMESDKVINYVNGEEPSPYKYNGYAEDEDDEFEEKDISDAKKELSRRKNKRITPIKMMVTPMGNIPLTEHTRSGDIFNFWVGHTNFVVSTENNINILNNLDGVESLELYTKYRFRVSIGRAFDTQTVKKNIMIALDADYEKNS